MHRPARSWTNARNCGRLSFRKDRPASRDQHSAAFTQDTRHAVDTPYAPHGARQVDPVFDLDGEAQVLHRGIAAFVVHGHRDDVGVRFADLGRNARQRAAFIVDQDGDAAVEAAVQVLPPDQFDPAVGLLLVQALGGVALLGVDDQGLVGLQISSCWS